MIDKVAKLQRRLSSVLDDKNYYEAHQISRTIYYRWLEAGEFEKLIHFLYSTCLLFLHAREYTIALDLAELFVDTLNKSGTRADEDVLEKFAEIFSKLPAKFNATDNTNNEDSDRRTNLLNKAVNWSASVADTSFAKQRGSSELHLKLALIFWSEGNLEAARNHFLVSDSPEKFAEFLVEAQQKQPSDESDIDTLIAQTVFQLLCYKKLKSSVVVFQHYTSTHPRIGSKVPYKWDLLNFIWLMLRSLYQRNLAYFTELVDQYQATIARDQSYYSYLDKIGQLYLGLPPSCAQAPSQGGLLGSILKELVSGSKPLADANTAKEELNDDEDEFWDMDDDGFMTAPVPEGLLDENSAKVKNAAGAASASSNSQPTSSKKAAEQADMDLD